MIKHKLKLLLQKVLGYELYLFIFAIIKILQEKYLNQSGDLSHFMNLCARRDGVILDIGANIGITSVLFSLRFPDRTILAFEPEPVNLKVLHKTLRFFKCPNVKIIPIALGEKSGEVEFVLPVVDKVRLQGLGHVVHSSITHFNDGVKSTVSMSTLDIECAGIKHIAGIKLDVENYENYVIEGGSNVLKRTSPIIICELWDTSNKALTFQKVKSLGYSLFALRESSLQIIAPESPNEGHYFFMPDIN